MPPGKFSRSRRTAPIDFPEAMTVHPSLEELADWPKFVSSLEERGAHHAGICKIVVPDDYRPRKRGYNVDDFQFKIDRPLKQCFSQVGERGAYQTKCLSKEPMSIRVSVGVTHIGTFFLLMPSRTLIAPFLAAGIL